MANIDFYTKKNLYVEITKALTDSVSKLSSTNNEPDFVANVVCNLPPKLKDILKTCIPHLKFKVCGCFIHNTPKMEFCKRKKFQSAELGDLLLVYKEESKDGDKLYNALLLQAKKNDYAKTVDKRFCSKVSGNPTQLILYTKWPKFRYTQPASLASQTRDIYPKTIHNGAQYLLINPYQPVVEFWCSTANNKLCASYSFASQIIRLLEFQSGDAFVEKPPKKDGWSTMIWDLLQMTCSASFNQKNQFFKKSRTSGDSILLDFMNIVGDGSSCAITSNGDYGIPLIYIEAEESSTDL